MVREGWRCIMDKHQEYWGSALVTLGLVLFAVIGLVAFAMIRDPGGYYDDWVPGDGIDGPEASYEWASAGLRVEFTDTSEIGDVPIKAINGFPVLDPLYARKGWALYEDLCAGKVDGIPADPAAWQRWQQVINLRAHGRDLPPHCIDELRAVLVADEQPLAARSPAAKDDLKDQR